MTGLIFKRSNGSGLIEVLVTMLLLSTTLITLAALQTRSLQYNHASYLGSQANILAYDILDRMRVNKSQIANYASVPPAAFVSSTAPVTPRSAVDIYSWRQNIDTQMPGAMGSISCNASNICTIQITWNEVNSQLLNRENVLGFTYMSRL